MLPVVHIIRKIHPNDDFVLITNKTKKKHHVFAWDVFKYLPFFKYYISYSKNIIDLLKLIIEFRKNKNSYLYILAVRTKRGKKRDYIFFKYFCNVKNIIGLIESDKKYIRKKNNGFMVKMQKDSEKFIRIVENHYSKRFERPTPPLLPIPSNIKIKINELLKTTINNSNYSFLIAMGVSSNRKTTRWSKDKYLEIINRLISYNAFIFLLGSKNEHQYIQYFVDNANNKENIINLSGITSIIESAELLLNMNLYIGNDTGTSHLAAIMGTPSIIIFSARNSHGIWEPYGENHIVIRKRISCEGCYLDVCEKMKNKCLDIISIDEVWSSISLKLHLK